MWKIFQEKEEEKPPTNRSQPIFGRFRVPKSGFGFGFATVLPQFHRKFEQFEYFCGIKKKQMSDFKENYFCCCQILVSKSFNLNTPPEAPKCGLLPINRKTQRHRLAFWIKSVISDEGLELHGEELQ